MTALERLRSRWRDEAEFLRRNACDGQAIVIERLATELETALRDEGDESLTLEQAAQESGYSADRLRHMIAEGVIPNAGRRGSPRLLRRNLPRKAKRNSVFDPDAAARRTLSRGQGA